MGSSSGGGPLAKVLLGAHAVVLDLLLGERIGIGLDGVIAGQLGHPAQKLLKRDAQILGHLFFGGVAPQGHGKLALGVGDLDLVAAHPAGQMVLLAHVVDHGRAHLGVQVGGDVDLAGKIVLFQPLQNGDHALVDHVGMAGKPVVGIVEAARHRFGDAGVLHRQLVAELGSSFVVVVAPAFNAVFSILSP